MQSVGGSAEDDFKRLDLGLAQPLPSLMTTKLNDI